MSVRGRMQNERVVSVVVNVLYNDHAYDKHMYDTAALRCMRMSMHMSRYRS